jgi:hypothetical protein
MFFKRKKAEEKTKKANERLVRKVLGKESARRVFGFCCDAGLWARMKMLADKMNVPLFGLMEHSTQISAGLMAKMAENEEEREELRRHIMDVHVGQRAIEKISRFDEEMADILDGERRHRFQVESAVRQIVLKYEKRGLSPREIDWSIDYALRCITAITRGQPVPTDLPPEKEYPSNRR